jgi:hypothetical protein
MQALWNASPADGVRVCVHTVQSQAEKPSLAHIPKKLAQNHKQFEQRITTSCGEFGWFAPI